MELERVAVGIFDLDLGAARTGFDLVAETHAGGAKFFDLRLEIGDEEDDAVPAAGLLFAAVGHGARARAARAAQQQTERTARYCGERGAALHARLEAEMPRVERDRPFDVGDLVTHDGG